MFQQRKFVLLEWRVRSCLQDTEGHRAQNGWPTKKKKVAVAPEDGAGGTGRGG